MPACARCTSRGHTCEYPEPSWTFVLYGAADQPGDAIASSSTSELNRTSSLEQYQAAFWNIYLPETHEGLISLGELGTVPRLPQYQQIVAEDTDMQNALTALSLACISQHDLDLALYQEAVKFYTKALHLINRSLQSPGVRTKTLAACRMLSLYELFRPDFMWLPSSGTDWRHAQGVGSLVNLCEDQEKDDRYMHLITDVLGMMTCCAMSVKDPSLVPDGVLESSDLAPMIQVQVMRQLVDVSGWLKENTGLLLASSQAPEERLTIMANSLPRALQIAQDMLSWQQGLLRLCLSYMALSPDQSANINSIVDTIPYFGEALAIPLIQHLSAFSLLCAQVWLTSTVFKLEGWTGPPLPVWTIPTKPMLDFISIADSVLSNFRPSFWLLEQITIPIKNVACLIAATHARESPECQFLADFIATHSELRLRYGSRRIAGVEINQEGSDAAPFEWDIAVEAACWYHSISESRLFAESKAFWMTIY